MNETRKNNDEKDLRGKISFPPSSLSSFLVSLTTPILDGSHVDEFTTKIESTPPKQVRIVGNI